MYIYLIDLYNIISRLWTNIKHEWILKKILLSNFNFYFTFYYDAIENSILKLFLAHGVIHSIEEKVHHYLEAFLVRKDEHIP